MQSVTERYAQLLPAEDRVFVARFEALDYGSRHLYCRLITRRGPWFRCSRLDYPDIGPLEDAITRLVQEGLARYADAATPAMARVCTQAELASWFGLPASMRKSAIIDHLHTIDCSPLLAQERWLHFDQSERLRRFEICYFGNRHQGLESFVITELGHLRWEAYRLDTQHLHFPDAADLQATLQLMQLQDELQVELRDADETRLQAWYAQLPDHHGAVERRGRVLHDLARRAERIGAILLANTWHREGNTAASRERLARLALRDGRQDEAYHWLTSLLSSCTDPAIRETAADLIRRHRLGQVPARFEPASQRMTLSRQADIHSPPEPFQDTRHDVYPNNAPSIERRVAHQLRRDGAQCIHGENVLHRSLLGLLIWDILFADIPGAFSNPFQRAPLDFREPGFAIRRKGLLDARLYQTDDSGWHRIMQDTFEKKHGISNALVHWEFLDSMDWAAAAKALTTRVMRVVFARLLQHPGEHGSGLPDLLWWNEQGDLKLIEVKGPGDTLQPHQRAWLEWLARHGVPAEVLYVDYV